MFCTKYENINIIYRLMPKNFKSYVFNPKLNIIAEAKV